MTDNKKLIAIDKAKAEAIKAWRAACANLRK